MNLDTSGFMDLISTVEGDVEYVDDMPVGEIYPDVEQPRVRNLDEEGVQDIIATFKITKGRILQPILVQEKDDKGHKILMGNRRWVASDVYGNPTIPTLIIKSEIDSKLFLQLIENIARKDLDIREEGHSYKILKTQGKNNKTIAEGLGKSETYISEAIMLADMEDDPKLVYFNNLYEKEVCRDVSTLAALVRIARKDATACEKLVKWAIENNKLTRKWAKSLNKVDLESSYEEQIAAFEERKEFEKQPASKTPVPAGMTSDTKGDGQQDSKLNSEVSTSESQEESENESFELESEEDGVQNEYGDSSSGIAFKKKRVADISVTHEGTLAKLLLDRVDTEEGFGWILFENSDGKPVRVDLSELSLIYVG